jgi:uncharacterized Zn ribbon protein
VVQPCRCRICDAFVYIDEGPDGTCPECARLIDQMATATHIAEARAVLDEIESRISEADAPA